MRSTQRVTECTLKFAAYIASGRFKNLVQSLDSLPAEFWHRTTSRDSTFDADYVLRADGSYCFCTTTFSDKSSEFSGFGAVSRVLPFGPEAKRDEIAGSKSVDVTGADSIVVLTRVVATTDLDEALRYIEEVATDWSTLLSRHRALHPELFHRSDLEIGKAGNSDIA